MEFVYVAILAVWVVFGSFLQSLIGLGFVMVVAPFLVLFDSDFLPVPMLLVVTFLSLLIAWRDRKEIDLS